MRPAVLLLCAWVGCHYASPPQYDFPPAQPFAGEQWYDPYATEGDWLRANFHAHSRAWGWLTSSTDTPEQVRAAYRDLGYDVYALSNYQQIFEPGPGDGVPITAYEHGYNIKGHHHTVLGASEVRWINYSLPWTVHHKQFVLDTLRPSARALVINHPTRYDSYTVEDFRKLVGYTGLEILTKRSRSRPHWDAALSSGRPVWGFCADDGRELARESSVGIGWNMILSPGRSADAVLDAIRAGSFYGVWTRHEEEPNVLLSAALADGRLSVRVERPADEIRFIGQDGRLLAAVRDTDRAAYEPQPVDTYVRTEVETGDTLLTLNPVFRHAGDPLAHPAARRMPARTWALRGGIALAVALIALASFRRRPARQDGSVTPARPTR